jgi:hypothetical protein
MGRESGPLCRGWLRLHQDLPGRRPAGMQGVGAAIAGTIAEHISPAMTMAVLAAMSVTVTLLLAPGLRPRRKGPATPDPEPIRVPLSS